jgi:hypothetical protein
MASSANRLPLALSAAVVRAAPRSTAPTSKAAFRALATTTRTTAANGALRSPRVAAAPSTVLRTLTPRGPARWSSTTSSPATEEGVPGEEANKVYHFDEVRFQLLLLLLLVCVLAR